MLQERLREGYWSYTRIAISLQCVNKPANKDKSLLPRDPQGWTLPGLLAKQFAVMHLCGLARRAPAQRNTNRSDAGGSGERGVRGAGPGEGQGCQCCGRASCRCASAVDAWLSTKLGAGREESSDNDAAGTPLSPGQTWPSGMNLLVK